MLKTAIRKLLAKSLAYGIPKGIYYDARFFELWQSRGIHITPVSFYEPVPDTSTLSDDVWTRTSALPGVEMNESRQLELLSEFDRLYKHEYQNGLVDGERTTDWEVHYSMIRHFKPRRIIEVGAGLSTRFAACAITRNSAETGTPSTLMAIDPYPGEALRKGFPGLSELKAVKVQEVALEEFEVLEENDILFIDSSHVLKIGSDVQYLYLEVIPRLRKGVIVHAHDIFFPREYHREWVMDLKLFWNEAYLLQAFLAFNSVFQVLWSSSFLRHRHPQLLHESFDSCRLGEDTCSSLWMQRVR